MDLSINIDGASRGNPGPASAGIVIRNRDTGAAIHEGGYLLGKSTNNVAEYNALLRALEVAHRIKTPDVGEIHFHSDSQLLVRQITGEYRVKSADLQPLVAQAQASLRKLGTWRIHHVPREENRRADELANMALDAGRDVIVVGGTGPAAAAGSAVPTAPASTAPAPRPAASGVLFRAKLATSPGPKCPARCPAKTPFAFGPSTPPGFCVYAAQAVFDENPTLWREARITEAQTQCPRCDVTIDICVE